MKKSHRNPKKWEWYLPVVFLAAGIVLLFTPWKDGGVQLLAVAVGLKCGLNIRWNNYHALSPEEQRDADREERDERNLMLRDRAAWLCWQGEEIVFAAAALFFLYTAEADWHVILLIGLFWIVHTLAYALVRRWLDKKY